MKRIFGVFLRFFLPISKSWVRIIQTVCWSSMDIVFWGIFSHYLASTGKDSFSLPTIILSATVFWNFFTRSLNNFSAAFVDDIRMRNLPNILSSPLSFYEYLGGIALVSSVVTLFSIGFMTVVAYVLFAFNIFTLGFLLIPYAVVIFIFGWALGIVSVALILRFGPSVDQIMWLFQTLILPFSSIFYPLASMPPFFRVIASFIPLSWLFEGMRFTLVSGSFALQDFLIALGGALIFCALALGFLFIVLRYVRRKGTITRFMTE